MFMFDQVYVLPPTEFVVTSVRIFEFDHVIMGKVTEEDITPPNMIGVHTQDRVAWSVDSHHCCLEFDDIFSSKNPYVNNTNNIRR